MKYPEKPPPIDELAPNAVHEFILNPDLINELDKITSNKYPFWEELKYKCKHLPINPQYLWFFLKLNRRSISRKLYFSETKDYQFQFVMANHIIERLHNLDLNMGGNLYGNELHSQKEKERYLISSIMEEAIASSQLEGAVTTREKAKEMLRANKKPQNESEQMIMNNYITMKWIMNNKNIKMNDETICKIHGMITQDTLDKKEKEGNYRSDNRVTLQDDFGNVFYTPPNSDELQKWMQLFIDFANDEGEQTTFIHPIIKGIILHFMIGYIHPFSDGNGRTARALFYWYLIRKGYWLVEYMSISKMILKAKSQYARAYLYTEYDENDLTYFIDYNTDALSNSLIDLQNYIERKRKERMDIISIIENSEYNQRQVELIRRLMMNDFSILTVKTIENYFNISNSSARNDLYELVNHGILKETKKGKKALFTKGEKFEEIIKSDFLK